MLVTRIRVLVYEIVAEAFILGTLMILMAVLFSPLPEITRMDPTLLLALPIAFALVLFFQGYYLTRAFVGLVWRSEKRWTYPAIAATLFVAHMLPYWPFFDRRLDPKGHAVELLLLPGGAFIVFACAYAGNWLLRKWTKPDSNESDPQSHPPDPLAPDVPEIAPEG